MPFQIQCGDTFPGPPSSEEVTFQCGTASSLMATAVKITAMATTYLDVNEVAVEPGAFAYS